MFGEQGKCQMSKGGGKKRDGRDRPAFLSPLSLSEILCSAPSHWPAKNGLLLSPSELRAKRAPSGLAWHPRNANKAPPHGTGVQQPRATASYRVPAPTGAVALGFGFKIRLFSAA
jgi:hypothetical protein